MPTVWSQASNEETERVAEELLILFMREQFTQEGPISPEIVSNTFDLLGNDVSILGDMGAQLREISEEFARSRERVRVREMVLRININDMTFAQFNSLLNQLFPNGVITRERIIVLFFFCSDLAFRVFTNRGIDYFNRLVEWSLNFIVNKICSWITRQGGWRIVLGRLFIRFVDFSPGCAII